MLCYQVELNTGWFIGRTPELQGISSGLKWVDLLGWNVVHPR